jgi:hypothetical protein
MREYAEEQPSLESEELHKDDGPYWLKSIHQHIPVPIGKILYTNSDHPCPIDEKNT